MTQNWTGLSGETDDVFLSEVERSRSGAPAFVRVADASNRIYFGAEPLGTAGDNATYSITTDGKDGVLLTTDIISFQVSLTLSGVTRMIDSANGAAFTQDDAGGFTATPTDLFFDFSSTYPGTTGFGAYVSFKLATADTSDEFCFQTMSGCYYGASSGPVGAHYPPFTLSSTPIDQNAIVASRTLPGDGQTVLSEPATLSLLPLGLAVLWLLRRNGRA